MAKKLILLDAHAIIHRAYHALPQFSASGTGEPTGALYGLVAMLLKMITDLKPDYIVACFDLAGPTHRHEAYEAYKGHRKELDQALGLQLERAKDVFKAFGIPIYSHPGFEADDIIGTIVFKGRTLKDSQGSTLDIIVASGDMDTMQLAKGKKVQVYTLKKGLNDTILYDEGKMRERFGFNPKNLVDYKGLRGDPSDNIIGVKGIGEKTATDLIQEFGTIENIYKNIKKVKPERVKKLLEENKEEALFSKTLATIRTDAPINFVLPKPWQECFELERVLTLFKELGFRTLSERIKKFGNNIDKQEVKEIKEDKDLQLALWVIDSNLTNPTIEDVLNFVKTESVEEARKILEQELDKREVRKVYEEIERPLMPVVEKMNQTGVKIDKKALDLLSKNYHKELSRIEKEIWKLAGEEFNINSPKILGDILFNKLGLAEKRQKKTPGGALSTRESELEKIKDKHPIISLIIEYRELAKLLSTYIDAIPPLLDKDSRLHSTFIQSGTTTGRMGSNNPNLQNIPIKSALGRAIRTAFVAEKGFKLLSLDYSQIELRLAAILSGDKKLIEIFKNDEDVHKAVAEKIGIERWQAKAINFGILYGMGVTALQANLKSDRKTAQEFYNEYFETFSDLAAYIEKVKAEAGRKGYTTTLFGRRRYFTGFRSPLPYVRAQAERMAINAPIQGTQADIIKIAMIRISEKFPDIRMILQVHDELVFEVEEEKVEKLAKEFKKIMESVLGEEEVPIVAEAHIGDNWGEMIKVDSK